MRKELKYPASPVSMQKEIFYNLDVHKRKNNEHIA